MRSGQRCGESCFEPFVRKRRHRFRVGADGIAPRNCEGQGRSALCWKVRFHPCEGRQTLLVHALRESRGAQQHFLHQSSRNSGEALHFQGAVLHRCCGRSRHGVGQYAPVRREEENFGLLQHFALRHCRGEVERMDYLLLRSEELKDHEHPAYLRRQDVRMA